MTDYLPNECLPNHNKKQGNKKLLLLLTIKTKTIQRTEGQCIECRLKC